MIHLIVTFYTWTESKRTDAIFQPKTCKTNLENLGKAVKVLKIKSMKDDSEQDLRKKTMSTITVKITI